MSKSFWFKAAGAMAFGVWLGSPASLAVTIERVHPDDGVLTLPGGNTDVIYSQLDDPSGYALVDQAFEAAYAGYDTEAADDFVWSHGFGSGCVGDIQGLSTPGALSMPPADPLFVNVAFYADAGGLPGAALPGCEFPAHTQFFSNGLGDLTIELECGEAPTHTPLWVSQQVRQDFTTQGIHYWSTRATSNLEPAVWRNPGGGFGTACADWQPANAVCGAVGSDMLFELIGHVDTLTCDGWSDCAQGPCLPAMGPIAGILLVLSLGGSAAWVLRRRG